MNKNILITGSTDGIGKLTAHILAKQGHQIYIHGRNPEKVANTISELKKSTENENIFGFTADFSDLNEVVELAQNINSKIDSIDVLINNAGVFKSTHKNYLGLDLRFAVNYLAPYTFTQYLLPVLQRSNSSRVINLSSAAQSTIDLNALEGKTDISMQESYAQSKLALTMWSFDFAKKHSDVLTIAVNPGSLLNTKMVKEAYGNHWSSADKGANILVELATSENLKEFSGSYFDNDRGSFGEAHQDAYDEQKIESLLSATNNLLEQVM
ncbi:SDR family NAD(P)-dependent oxidoreductase [Tenacibaculum sp. 190524A05c]|uniref:SDR family NAD(P)-dependent oxidoreductase n=1 Tax=Tenacibaculum platacis TaxID=3137852 RepID=UPI0031FB2B2C